MPDWSVYLDGVRKADAAGPIPPVGAMVWYGGWCRVERIDWYLNSAHLPGRPSRMCCEVYLVTEDS